VVTLLLVAVGGFFGAIARYLVDFWVVSHGVDRVPLGTLIVNVSGSFGLGLLVGGFGSMGGPEWVMAMLGAGFLAAYTTFSTWMFEAARLIQRGAVGATIMHLAVTIVLGIVAAVAGLVLGLGLGRSI
jgi:fluoride exporter